VARIAALIVIFVIVIVSGWCSTRNTATLVFWADENTAWRVSGIIANAINPFWVVDADLPAGVVLGPAQPARPGSRRRR